MKISQIKNWVDSLKHFIRISEIAEIQPGDLSNLIKLDPELEKPMSYVYRLFSKTEVEATEETTEETATITATTAPVTTTDETIVEEIPVEETTSTSPVITETTDEFWKVHPKMPEYRLSPEGKVQKLDKTNGWYDIPVMKRNGYMVFHKYQLARCMLETYDSVRDRHLNPFYKDGNKENCRLDNLCWSNHRNTHQTDTDIERACKLIVEYANKPAAQLINALSDINIGRTCYLSILRGNHKNISDKYFTVKGGKIIPNSDVAVVEEKKEEKSPITLPTEQPEIPIDLINLISFTKDSELIKKNFPERPSQSDKYALILSYVKDGKKTSEEIQKSIHRDFGKRIFISNLDIDKVLSKSVYTEICNKIF